MSEQEAQNLKDSEVLGATIDVLRENGWARAWTVRQYDDKDQLVQTRVCLESAMMLSLGIANINWDDDDFDRQQGNLKACPVYRYLKEYLEAEYATEIEESLDKIRKSIEVEYDTSKINIDSVMETHVECAQNLYWVNDRIFTDEQELIKVLEQAMEKAIAKEGEVA